MSRVADTKNWSVYVITCLVTKQQYVGITGRSIWHRFGRHFDEAYSLKHNYPIAAAIRLHGQSAFTIELACVCSSIGEAHAAERRLIDELGTLSPRGFNQTRGGHGRLGMKMSREWRLEQSQRLRASAAEKQWGTQISEVQRKIWSNYTPAQRAQRIENSARQRRGRTLGPRTSKTIRSRQQLELFT
jgi:group I intron endonuclease